MKRVLAEIRRFLKSILSLAEDQDNEHEIIDAIKKSVTFRGVNLWMLIFATIIASVGLNVNSTAVIIGAMLISPLMGPIMGIGLGAGISDLKLVKNAWKNLFIAVTFSIVTSAIYFKLSPLNIVQSELLSRTEPSFWDVLIALFGGFAGVLAGSSKEKGNAIPGVAIATALMPPLCTAGFGLANLNLQYFFGAMYLFFINCVMIGTATYVAVQFLNFKKVDYLDKQKSKQVTRAVTTLMILAIVPSIYLTVNLVAKSRFQIEAQQYINQEYSNEPYYVLNDHIKYNNRGPNEITLYVGGFMDSIAEYSKNQAMSKYGIENTTLIIKQGNQLRDILENEQIEMNQQKLAHNKEIAFRDSIINDLNSKVKAQKSNYYSGESLFLELKTFLPTVKEFSIDTVNTYSENDTTGASSVMVIVKPTRGSFSSSQRKLIEHWIDQRLNIKKVKVVVD